MAGQLLPNCDKKMITAPDKVISYRVAAFAAIERRKSVARLCLRLPLLALFVIAPLAGIHGQEQPADDVGSSFVGYDGAPDLTVVSRKSELFFYPCDQCHAAMEPNPAIRQLNVMHDAEIDHGMGRIWCLSCHDLEERNMLRTLLGNRVDFDDAHLVCGGCHANRHKDWSFGVHGKRVDNWQGERTVYSCTHCHNPHSPAIAPRAPSPAPNPRAGLELEEGEIHRESPVWERQEDHEE